LVVQHSSNMLTVTAIVSSFARRLSGSVSLSSCAVKGGGGGSKCMLSTTAVATAGNKGDTVQPAMSPVNTVRPLVLCGPSGAGKSTIMKKLTAEFPDAFGFSVSHTTRQPREGEEDGVHYHYVTREVMTAAIEAGDFIENAEFSANMYGTSKKAVQSVLEQGKICILDIEMQGVILIKKTEMNPCYVFIKPPSLEILEQRLRDRKTDSEDAIQRRLDTAKREMEYGAVEGNFDIVITNDELDKAYTELRTFILPEIEKTKTK